MHCLACTNRRTNGRSCGSNKQEALIAYLKQRVRRLVNDGVLRNARVSKTGCLGRCASGPSLVVYPDGVWYRLTSNADVELIVEQHLGQGKRVAHLLMDASRSPAEEVA